MSDKSHINSGTGALFRALSVSFAVLRVLIVLLLIASVFSGSFTVKENEQALILRFGKIVGEPGHQLLDSGTWHWAWPEPIDKIVRIPVKKTVRIESSKFWFSEEMMEEESYASDNAQLVPGRDGFLITGDSNIIHLKTAAFCRIADPIKYEFTVLKENRKKLLENTMNSAVLNVLATWKVKDALYLNVKRLESELQQEFEKRITNADIGLRVVDFIVESKSAPRAVVSSFTNVLEMALRKDTDINEAKTIAEATLTKAKSTASKLKSSANLYKARLVSSMKADAQYFQKILKEYKKDPQTTTLTLYSIYSNTVSETMDQAGEKFILPANKGQNSELRLRLNREAE